MAVQYEAKFIELEPEFEFFVDSGNGESDTSDPFDDCVEELYPATLNIPTESMFKVTYISKILPVELVSSTATNPIELKEHRAKAFEIDKGYLLINDIIFADDSGSNLGKEDLMGKGIYLEDGLKITATVFRYDQYDDGLSGDAEGNYRLKLRVHMFGILETQT